MTSFYNLLRNNKFLARLMQSKVLKSFIQHSSDNHFPIQNIPFGVFFAKLDHTKQPRCCTRIGDFVVDLAYLEEKNLFDGPLFKKIQGTKVFNQPNLNAFMQLGIRFYLRQKAYNV